MSGADWLLATFVLGCIYLVVKNGLPIMWALFREDQESRRWLRDHPHLAGRDAPDGEGKQD
jgi:hypothetical protein